MYVQLQIIDGGQLFYRAFGGRFLSGRFGDDFGDGIAASLAALWPFSAIRGVFDAIHAIYSIVKF